MWPGVAQLGQYTDAETGFQYLRARYYDPATGNFLTRDPIEAVTREPYGYVGGNPLNRVDPSGLDWWDPRDNVLPGLGEAAQDTGEFAVRNRDTIASVGAVAACIGTVGTGCVAATAAAVSVRSEKRFRENGVNRGTVGVAVFDGVFSWARLGLVKIPAQLATTRLADPLARGVPVVTGRLSRLAIDSGLSGLLGGLGFLARRQLDRGLNQPNC